MPVWNPWHGCHKISPGCANCYVYRTDAKYGIDSGIVAETGNFNLPLKKNRAGDYKLQEGETVYTCFTSDFFLEDADPWRPDIWQMIRQRGELHFLFITKRIHRFGVGLPPDWGEGYENVTICTTVENQDRADARLPLFLELPILHRRIVCEPLLEPMDLSPYLKKGIQQVIVGGESGNQARICHYDWVLALQEQCQKAGVAFWFKQTGAKLVKEGRLYQIPRKYQHVQATKAGINLL